MDLWVAVAGLIVGGVVGLTGMGGGALMTPILVLLFKVEPLAAVSSDLVAALVMKPIGGGVHFRHGTVNLKLVKWLVMGSIPAAFGGVWILYKYGAAISQQAVKYSLGIALLMVAAAIVLRPALMRFRRRKLKPSLYPEATELNIKPVPTLLIGVLGGLIVGLTSVGSGSIMIMALLMLYPAIRLSDLVGTDLVQAIPLVGSAALGHFLFGEFHVSLTASILIGAIPGVYFGARYSARAPDHIIRPILVVVLVASSFKLLGVGNWPTLLTVLGLIAVGLPKVIADNRARQAEAAAAAAAVADVSPS